MPPGAELIVADGWPAGADSPAQGANSAPLGREPEPLDPQTEHMAKGVAAALRSLMLSYAEPDGWLPPLLDEQPPPRLNEMKKICATRTERCSKAMWT